ncbi:MAG TPA: alpha/beta fold hydrolase [Roseiflexaceae bacterium]|nr:alpha/beta fold hydrolase [Roseiflexaceae bacterium]
MTVSGMMPVPAELRAFSREAVLENGLRLHYYEAGAPDAPPLILIHGLGDEADTWRHVLIPLSQQYRVIALDLPGFGRSARPRRAYTLGFYAQSVASLMARLGIGRAALAGSSLGAAIAQRVALARPDLVERLILVDGALPIEAHRPSGRLWWFLAPGIGEAVYTSLRRSQDRAYATLRPYYADLDALPAEDRAFLRERVWARVWNSGQRRAFLSTLRWLAIEGAFRAPALRERLTRLATPTLLIWGGHDQIAPQALAEQMAALLPNARLHVIADSGHLPQQERPAALIAAIRG